MPVPKNNSMVITFIIIEHAFTGKEISNKQ